MSLMVGAEDGGVERRLSQGGKRVISKRLEGNGRWCGREERHSTGEGQKLRDWSKYDRSLAAILYDHSLPLLQHTLFRFVALISNHNTRS